jgi:hypothetical protein
MNNEPMTPANATFLFTALRVPCVRAEVERRRRLALRAPCA